MRQVFGKQQDWVSIKKNIDKPIITIITATFNVADSLHWTYESIKNQTYPYIQWIVVDGNSKDDTVKLLKQYGDVIDVWFSEPDTGIYNAWNKALEYIQGDWVQFLGAGDEIRGVNTIENIVNELQSGYLEHELISTDIELLDENRIAQNKISGNWNKKELKYSLLLPILPPHPGIFHRKCLFEKYKFDEEFRIISDSLFLLTNTNLNFGYISVLSAGMALGGISTNKESYMRSYKEMLRAVDKYHIKQSNFNRLKSYIKVLIKG